MRMAIGVAVFFAIGCGDDGGESGGVDAPKAIDAPGTQPDAEVPQGYTRLLGRSWSLTAGQLDTYRCMRLTIPTDTYITNIVAQSPAGTHHTVLSISSGGTAGPDGEYNCDVGELGMQMLYASGVGTSPLDFPTDVGVKIEAGTQIHLNLHLFNATDQPLSGDSGIYVKSQSTPTPILAEMVFAGKFLIDIPSTNQPHSEIGGCPVSTPYTLFAVWPHMHQLATHQRVELIRSGSPTMLLHNLDFDFEEQTYYPKNPPVEVLAGDNIRVTCTYINNTGSNVGFGDSSNTEMCFAGLYRYPAANAGLFQCTEAPGGIPGF